MTSPDNEQHKPGAGKGRLSAAKLAQIRERLAEEGLADSAAARIQPRAGSDPARLSFTQERLWFLEQMSPGSPVFNIPAAYELKGELDAERLEEAFRQVLARHAVLRTRFGLGPAAAPVQIVEATVDFRIAVQPAATLAEAQRAAREIAREPFDLERAPLLRAHLWSLSDRSHLLLVVLHHIAAEVQSLAVLTRELAVLYRTLASGAPPESAPLPELEVQFADFAEWQRELVAGAYEGQLAYWTDKLGGDLPTLQLFTDRPRPTLQSFAGGTRTRPLPAALSEELRGFCQRAGVTPFMVGVGSLAALLSRYADQEDVLIGIPMTDRNRVEIEPLIGLFVNTLVLRNDLRGDPSFAELCERTREVVLGAQSHQELPFEHLVEKLQPDRDLSRSPLFQVAFLFQNASEAGADALELAPGLVLQPLADPLAVHTETSKFDLALILWDHGQGFSASFEFNRDLYDAQTIDRMLAHFERFLEDALGDPARPLSQLRVLPDDERRLLLETWNTTARALPKAISERRCAHELFEDQVDRDPNALAVQCGSESLTYGELEERANRLAHRLKALGVGPDVPVGICTERNLELPIGILGTLKAGGAYVPLDLSYPRDRLAYMLQDAGAPVVLSLSSLADRLPEHAGQTLLLDQDATLASESGARPERVSSDDNLAYLIYTSGSTGRPKGVELEHRGLINLLTWHQREYDVTPADRATHLAGLAFDASVWEVWPYLTAGASLHLVPEEVRLAPRELYSWLAKERITLSFLATPLAEALLREETAEGLALRAVLTGGDKLHAPPPAGIPYRLVNHYGPTENTVVATFCDVPPAAAHDEAPQAGPDGAPPIGGPIDNVRCYVLDRRRRLAPVGVPGELYVGGLSLARGYHGRADLTQEKFVPVPEELGADAGARLYATGDLVRYRADGQLEFLGRIDGQVKVRGFRIELGEIESVLAQEARVAEASVVLRPSGGGDASGVLVAYVVATAGAEAATPPELRTFLRESLPDYMVPSAFVTLDALPLTPNGKVDRRALPDPEEQAFERSFVRPEGELQQSIAKLWSEALGLADPEEVSADRNFFELGGHSLLLAQVHARLQDSLGTKLSIVDLFQHPTISELAAFLENRATSSDAVDASHDRAAYRRERMQRRRRIRDSQ